MKNIYTLSKPILIIIVFILVPSLVPDISYGQGRGKIYWTEFNADTDSGKIRRSNLNGSAVEDVLTDLIRPRDIALDLHNRKMYWVDSPANVYRANLDGSDIEEIINGDDPDVPPHGMRHKPFSIALNPIENKIYWGNNFPWEIRRADYDGSNIEVVKLWENIDDVFPIRVDAESLELDVKAGKMYFVDSLNDNLARANLDGTNYEELGISMNDPYGLVLDLQNRQMYWTQIFGQIRTASLNGDNKETLLTELSIPSDIALHIRSGKIYWIESTTQKQNGENVSSRKIRRANLDGSGITDIITELENYTPGLVIDPYGVYDVTPETNKLTTTWASMKFR